MPTSIKKWLTDYKIAVLIMTISDLNPTENLCFEWKKRKKRKCLTATLAFLY
uniref:Uncharacterized protein n=1 Tax=Anguilla anguilla TaxID=7936 RepID=A0A0E9QD97_ANGAN